MGAKNDDLEAVRLLAETLDPFPAEDRERIIRWARERVGMAPAAVTGGRAPSESPPAAEPLNYAPAVPATSPSADIKSFVNEKLPKSDVHFAATVAYYHQFVAPAGQRKDSITKEDLVEACRQVPRKRPKRPAQVLVNAYQDGILDRGGAGHYKLNSVGENLVAMALPGTSAETTAKRKAGQKRGPKRSERKGSKGKAGRKKGARKGR